MGGGPKFPHTVACDVVTDASSGTPYRIGGQAAPVARRQIRARDPGRRERAKGRPSSEGSDAGSREKPLALSAHHPYRERTHVVKESILR